MRGLGWMGAAMVAMIPTAACVEGTRGPGTSGAPLTVGQLEERLATGVARVELKLRDGRPSELHVELADREERVQGWVSALDAGAGTLTIDDLGVVTLAAGARFRTDDESHASREAWVAEIEAALGAGAPVFVRASRLATGVPQAPDDASFVATDLRIEDDGDPKLELDVDGDNFASPPPTLLVLGRGFEVGALRMSDDGAHDVGDDHGDDGVEVGDDNGGDDDGPELGDDNGDDGVEVGDDNGNNDDDGPGDDNGGDDDRDDDGPGDDHGGDGDDDVNDDRGGDDDDGDDDDGDDDDDDDR
ncbi:MAG: hypothetical protein IT385_02500 [Deltaproteobacteria bacterium]|nr:hypothetical protein [Deltaproteobacteria bacterium]